MKNLLTTVQENKKYTLAVLLLIGFLVITFLWSSDSNTSRHEGIETGGLSFSSPSVSAQRSSVDTAVTKESYRDDVYFANQDREEYFTDESLYNPETERRLVKTGNLQMSVQSIEDARAKIKNIALSNKGFVSNENFYIHTNQSPENQSVMSGSLSLRIPSGSFEEVMDTLRDIALVVKQDSSYSSDITEQYTDLETRLTNKRAEESQYRSLLSKAENVTETLEVTQYIERARNDAEQLEGRLNMLTNQSELSTIEVYLESEQSIAVWGVDWNPKQVLSESVQNLFSGLIALVNQVLRIVVLLPLLALYVGVIALGVYTLYKLFMYFKRYL